MRYATVTVIIIFLLAASGFGLTIHVPSEQPTIQAGIDVAVDGDTVLVAEGTYTGDGNRDIDFFGKAIVVRSENGPEVTVVDCEGSEENQHRGVNFHNNEGLDSHLQGFMIQNGYILGIYPDQNGGGIICEQSSPSIQNCILMNNFAAYNGGAIFCSDYSSPFITDCIISENITESGTGGGICCQLYSHPTISNSSVLDNTRGGIYCYYSDASIENCIISGNRELGGIHCLEGDMNISNCTISHNTSYYGGGLSIGFSNSTIENCIILQNTASGEGGGIFFGYSDFSMKNCLVIGNNAEYGGGIYCSGVSSPSIFNCTIYGNIATSGGGGIYNKESNLILTNLILWENQNSQVYLYSGHVFIFYSDIQGGWMGEGNIDADPLFIDPENSDFHLIDLSPCIDRGTDEGAPEHDFEGDTRWDKPDMPNNPTIVDMGMDEFTGPGINNVLVYLNVEETQIHQGEELPVDARVLTNFQEPRNIGYFWMMATLPGLQEYGPIYGPYSGPVDAGYQSFGFDFSLNVPLNAPFGLYTLIANAGLYPDRVVASDTHEIEVLE